MKIFILFHGFGNVGDFAIFKGTLRVLRGVAPGAGITVVDYLPVPDMYLDDHAAWVSYHRLFRGLFGKVVTHTVSIAQLVSGQVRRVDLLRWAGGGASLRPRGGEGFWLSSAWGSPGGSSAAFCGYAS